MPDVIIVPLQPGFNDAFQSRDGIVGRELARRARRVMFAAKSQAGVRTGALKADINMEWTSTSGSRLTIRVGSSVPHALMHHQGTRPHVIQPKNAKLLRFVNRQGRVVFAKTVHHPGTRPNEYLTDNLRLAVE